MLNEGLSNINSELVIIGITEHNPVNNLDVLQQVSQDGFSLSARVSLLLYCKMVFGEEETEKYLQLHEDDSRFAWANPYRDKMDEIFKIQRDDSSESLLNAIISQKVNEIRKAVNDGGKITTLDMLLTVIFSVELSNNTLEFLFANAMTLAQRCMAIMVLTGTKDFEEMDYDTTCNAVTILVNLLIEDKGIIA